MAEERLALSAKVGPARAFGVGVLVATQNPVDLGGGSAVVAADGGEWGDGWASVS